LLEQALLDARAYSKAANQQQYNGNATAKQQQCSSNFYFGGGEVILCGDNGTFSVETMDNFYFYIRAKRQEPPLFALGVPVSFSSSA
jgi:hypothetical protein